MLTRAFDKIKSGDLLTESDALALLQIEHDTDEYHLLINLADQYARNNFQSKGYIFAQIGLDAQKCSVNCKFCALAQDAYTGEKCEKPLQEVLDYAENLIHLGVSELFLMTTANYDKEKFLDYAREVKKLLLPNMKFVANVGDFDMEYAIRLKDAGFTGVYHICRLGEGVDTDVVPEIRIQTLDNIKNAGLELYYCVEPIGAEHTNEEIVREIFRAKEYPVKVMAVMKRIAVEGTRLFHRGEITAKTLAKITAVTLLCVKPERAMGVHEPDELCLQSGANQIYAEVGVNPRDKNIHTEESRGFDIFKARALLKKTCWEQEKSRG